MSAGSEGIKDSVWAFHTAGTRELLAGKVSAGRMSEERGSRMLAVMLFAISIVALSQFAVYYWRAVLTAVAGQPVSEQVLAAARVENGHVTGHDFGTLVGLHDLTPDLHPGRSGLGLVRLYYRLVDGIAAVAGRRMPAVAAWSERELAICARYAAVQIDRRLQANLQLAASLRSC
jgi:hypothetical protein